MADTTGIRATQIKAIDRQGTGGKIQMFGSGATVDGHVAMYDASGNVVDGGVLAAGAGGGASAAIWLGSGNPNGDPTDFAPHNMTSTTAPSPYAIYSSTPYASSTTWDGHALFDSLSSNSFWLAQGIAGFVTLDLGPGAAHSSSSYSVSGAVESDFANRSPSAWTLSGSNDNATWTVVDTQTGQSGWALGETRTFTMAATAPYRYWKFQVTANNGDSGFSEVSELYLYTTPSSPNTVGSVGDLFLDTTFKKLYGPKSSAHTWPLIGSLS
jgi:hypothetical protein